MDTPTRRARSLRHEVGALLGLVLTTGLAALLGGGTASAAEAAPPQLSIDVDDGHTSTTAGDTLVYTITIRNLGTDDARGLHITQSVPAGLEFGTAEPAATTTADGVGWGLDLKAAGEATFSSTMAVSATPAEVMRLATVACASATVDGPPIVCASHSDQLPAGASAEATREAAASSTRPVPWLVAGGAGILLAVVVLLLLLRRRTARKGSYTLR